MEIYLREITSSKPSNGLLRTFSYVMNSFLSVFFISKVGSVVLVGLMASSRTTLIRGPFKMPRFGGFGGMGGKTRT